ncbi:MAG: hypothetical protein ACLQBA_18465 [Candidatus Binataceae bacterium]
MQIFLSSIAKETGSYLSEFCSGKLKQRTLRRIFLPLILAAYFGSLIFAIWSFPGLFNWRTMSMSKLLYPSNNPQFHGIGSAGLAVAGLMTIPFAGYVGRRLRDTSPVLAEIGALSFGAGAISLTLGALIVWEPFLHEMFARGAGLGVGLGMLGFWEWIGSTAVFLFILSAALFLTECASQPAISSTPGAEWSVYRRR